MRLLSVLILLSTSSILIAACAPDVDVTGSADTSNDGCPPPNPGMCAPSPACENGVEQTGQASCVSGAWVCGLTPCVVDAGTVETSTDKCPPPNPGMCAPSPACENGVEQTGQASCVNGAWVCATTTCVVDAGCTKAIDDQDYDRACDADSDCAAVYSGSLCDDCFCPFGAIAASALASYQSDLQALGPFFGDCNCPAYPPPTCTLGVCTSGVFK